MNIYLNSRRQQFTVDWLAIVNLDVTCSTQIEVICRYLQLSSDVADVGIGWQVGGFDAPGAAIITLKYLPGFFQLFFESQWQFWQKCGLIRHIFFSCLQLQVATRMKHPNPLNLKTKFTRID